MKVPIYKAKTKGGGIAVGYFCIGTTEKIYPSIMGYIFRDDINEILWNFYGQWKIQLETLEFVKEVDVDTDEVCDFGGLTAKDIKS